MWIVFRIYVLWITSARHGRGASFTAAIHETHETHDVILVAAVDVGRDIRN
jgi:hypothetical protein